jgi:hypothetical protein
MNHFAGLDVSMASGNQLVLDKVSDRRDLETPFDFLSP